MVLDTMFPQESSPNLPRIIISYEMSNNAATMLSYSKPCMQLGGAAQNDFGGGGGGCNPLNPPGSATDV